MSTVVQIKFGETMPTPNLDALRIRMEWADWRKKWREAVENEDHQAMEWLDRVYDRVGLP